MRHTRLVSAVLLSVCCFILGGCVWFGSLLPEGAPSDNELLDIYYQTVPKESTSADVLSLIQRPKGGLLSQSESVVACWGEKKDGYKTWFIMVAFHEDELTVQRKYFFVADERPRSLPMLPKQRLWFDTEMVLNRDFIEQPFANENARRIAVLQHVLDTYKEDLKQLTPDNRKLGASGSMVNQTLARILQILDDMPALAVKLSEPAGLEFDHITLGRGRVRMVIRDDVVKVKIKIGTIIKDFAKQPDVVAM